MKKFQTLGKELTRLSMKKINGGTDTKNEGVGDCNCNNNEECTEPGKGTCYNGAAYECTDGTKIGWCEK